MPTDERRRPFLGRGDDPTPWQGASCAGQVRLGAKRGSLGRGVDLVHPLISTLKSFYIEISRALDWAGFAIDDAAAIQVQLQAVTGERIAARQGLREIRQPRRKCEQIPRPPVGLGGK